MNLNIQEFSDTIQKLFDRIDYKPFYNDVGLILENAVVQQFESSGQYFNVTPWAPLAASTIKDRKRKGFDTTSILRRTSGDAGLAGSIGSAFDAGKGTVTIGTNKYYAPFLQFGTKKMPARPFFPSLDNGLPADVIEDIKDSLEAFMQNVLG